MVKGVEPFLPSLSGKVEGTALRGILIKAGEPTGTYILSEEGKFYYVEAGSAGEISNREIAETVGVLEVGKALTNAFLSRLEQYNNLTNLWEETLEKVKLLTKR